MEEGIEQFIMCLPLSLSFKDGCAKIWPIWEREKDSLQKTKDAPVRTNSSADTIEREENCQEWKWSTAAGVDIFLSKNNVEEKEI